MSEVGFTPGTSAKGSSFKQINFLGVDITILVYIMRYMGGLKTLLFISFISAINRGLDKYSQSQAITMAEVFNKESMIKNLIIYISIQVLTPLISTLIDIFTDHMEKKSSSNLKAIVQFKILHGKMQEFLDKIKKDEIADIATEQGSEIVWALKDVQRLI